ncbi:RNA polymerase sigma factor [Pedobacter frigoris]|uniref:Sigma-70 family RNA polymerase sigma factor n=1 Tax=Pedobacter frigoris TaxID=2571272 RepID=A0A4V5NYX5_9SPHI|nr:hypothetical protein [Pedobacter frigoris]TKC05973.1 hypothetical protein FA047_11580 [Pedobacter frigoris]
MEPGKIDSASQYERYSGLTDEQLLSLFEKGDECAAGLIYEKYWKTLYISTFKILRNEEESRIIVKDVFATLFKHSRHLKIGSDVGIYLNVAVRHQVLCQISNSKSYDHLLESLSNYVQDKQQINTSIAAAVKLSY